MTPYAKSDEQESEYIYITCAFIKVGNFSISTDICYYSHWRSRGLVLFITLIMHEFFDLPYKMIYWRE